jgi:ParB-like chromosome segregation protein Spo0J
MTTTSQDEGITALYDELSVTALNPDALEPWISLNPPSGRLPKTTLDLGRAFFDLALWFESASPHHLTPHMKPEEFSVLKESIRQFGLLDCMIYINQRGVVVDGYHRMLAILELLQEGATLPAPEVRFIQFHRDQDELAFVLLMNVTRRMLDNDQKEEILKNLLRSGHDGTDNWLSRLCTLSPDKVSDVRAMLENIPIEDGGIEFQETRRSEKGSSHKQKKKEPETEKRRARIGLPTSGKKPMTKEKSKRVTDNSVPIANDTDIKPAKSEQELDAAPDVEIGIEPPHSDVADENADLRSLIEAWWKAFHFLPVLSRELAALGKEETPPKGDIDAITRRLKPLVGSELFGHLILYKQMSAGVAAFVLCPKALCQARGIDRDVLIYRAGSV